METKYSELLQDHFNRKRAAISSIEGHPRIKRQAFIDLAFEESLFEGLKDFDSVHPCIIDVVDNKFGTPQPDVVLCPVKDINAVRQNYPVYQISLFDSNDLDSVMFLVNIHRKEKTNPDVQFMIYPFKDATDSSSFDHVRSDMSHSLGAEVELLPLFVRDKGTLEWKPWLLDLEK
jgi:hypothetical protein